MLGEEVLESSEEEMEWAGSNSLFPSLVIPQLDGAADDSSGESRPGRPIREQNLGSYWVVQSDHRTFVLRRSDTLGLSLKLKDKMVIVCCFLFHAGQWVVPGLVVIETYPCHLSVVVELIDVPLFSRFLLNGQRQQEPLLPHRSRRVPGAEEPFTRRHPVLPPPAPGDQGALGLPVQLQPRRRQPVRSEERRVGKECRL